MRPPQKLGRSWDPPDVEWLKYQYLALGKSIGEIGDNLGSCYKIVKTWLKQVGIPLRTQAQAAAIINFRRVGNLHPLWKGGHENTFRWRAARKIRLAGIPKQCSDCGTREGLIEVHHIDGNVRNNELGNLQWLCRSCHRLEHNKRRK